MAILNLAGALGWPATGTGPGCPRKVKAIPRFGCLRRSGPADTMAAVRELKVVVGRQPPIVKEQ